MRLFAIRTHKITASRVFVSITPLMASWIVMCALTYQMDLHSASTIGYFSGAVMAVFSRWMYRVLCQLETEDEIRAYEERKREKSINIDAALTQHRIAWERRHGIVSMPEDDDKPPFLRKIMGAKTNG